MDSVEGDRKALIDLYNATGGDNWNNNNGWLEGNPSNNWYGVQVNSSGRVIQIKLNGTGFGQDGVHGGNNLNGVLPESIGNLKELRYLNLKHNFIEGEIPSSIGNMNNLTHLLLNGNQREVDKSKGINLNKFRPLHSNYRTNRFNGSIPKSIGELVNLKYLEINGIGLSKDEVDDGTGHPGLSGGIPSEIGNLSNLEGIYLNFNSIDYLPSTMQNLQKLVHLYIGRNKFAGTQLPVWFSKLKNLMYLDIEANNLVGSIPDLSEWSNFRIIWAAKNNFTGGLPSFFLDGSMPNINMIELAWNNLGGTLPNISNQNNLTAITLEGNGINGEIPATWGSAATSKLTNFGLGWNNFEGEFPDMSHAYKLRYIRARDNNFSGPLPKLNTNNQKLANLFFQNNNFSGPVDESIAIAIKNGRDTFGEVNISNNRFCESDIVDFVENVKALNKVERFYYGGQSDPVCDESGGSTKEPSEPAPAPSLQAPAVNATEVPVHTAFEWSSVSGADFYELQLNEKGASQLTADARVTGTIYDPSGDLAYSTTYEWRVRAEVNGEAGDWSRFRDFTTEADPNTNDGDDSGDGGQVQKAPAPAPVSPAHLGTDVKLNTVFEWDPVEGADYYELHSNRLDPTEMVIVTEVNETTYTHSSTLDPEATHHWRVRAVVNGEAGEWSPIWEFTTGTEAEQTTDEKTVAAAPVPVYPGNHKSDVSTEVEFKWNSVEGADYYELHSNRLNPDEMRIEADVTDTSYVHSSSLETGTTHHWRVRAVVNNEPGEWSNIWEFTTATAEEKPALASPVLHAPSNNIETESYTPTFEWAAVEGADYYVLQAGTQQPDEIIMEVTIDTNNFTPSQQLDPETAYHWRVRAVSDTLEGEWSEVWTFTTSKEQEVVTSVDPGEQPVQTGISQNYPNPFNPSTNIEFSLEEIQNVSLKVYDMAGRQVAVLVDGMRQAGRHSSTFKADHLASGVYFYRLVTDNQSFTKKMTLLK